MSASLYYLVAYMFMTIGSFAVVTVLGREGDERPRPRPVTGVWPGASPCSALLFAILLLAQAGVPFTTGLWAKLQVVLASISAGAVPLAVIAMVTAVIAAFFYLRVAVLMYASTPNRRKVERASSTPAARHRGRVADPLGQPRRRVGHHHDPERGAVARRRRPGRHRRGDAVSSAGPVPDVGGHRYLRGGHRDLRHRARRRCSISPTTPRCSSSAAEQLAR